MRPAFWQRLDSLARRLTPFGLTVILVLAALVPSHVPEFARVVPALAMVAVYHWAIHRPRLLPAWSVFLLGILQDALSGTALGLNVLMLLTVYGLVIYQRRFFIGKSFAVVWLGFCLVGAITFAEAWLLMSAISLTLLDPASMLTQYLLTVGAFPLVSWGFIRWQQVFLAYES
jgi:rod shape-determining protein MreD